MMKLVDPRTHGVFDYMLAVAFLVMPSLFNFTDIAATLSYVIGVAYLGTSLLTRYPLGALKIIPFPVHGVLESIMAAAWIAMPWLFGFSGDAAARNFFVVAGIGLLALAACTNYRAAEPGGRYKGADRRNAVRERRQQSVSVARDRRAGVDRRGTHAMA